jgi:exopolyphosphatase/guanosine-5'-triphosphate,3'-diphosphate pyrophosphatase
MNFAVVDLGTNTFNLLIASKKDKGFQAEYVTKQFVKLGEGGINHGKIQPKAFERGINTLVEYRMIANQYKCEQVFAIATSAIRNAANGEEFIQRAKEISGIDISVIQGDTEAELIYLGARGAVDFKDDTVMIMDVGGGSTEFIIGNKSEIFWKQSFEVGAARLFEAFHSTDPISIEDISRIENHLEQLLAPMLEKAKEFNVTELVGSSGAFTSFAQMIKCALSLEPLDKTEKSYTFDLNNYLSIHHKLLQSTLKERLMIPGLITERAPMIVVGTILVNFVLSKIGIQKFKLSRYALKEGVAQAYAENELKI